MKEYFKKKFYNKAEKEYSYMDLIKKSFFIFLISFSIGAVATMIYKLKDLFI